MFAIHMTSLSRVEFGMGMAIASLIKMCLNESCSTVPLGKRAFPFKIGLELGDALSPLLFKFALEYAVRKVQGGVEIEWYT